MMLDSNSGHMSVWIGGKRQCRVKGSGEYFEVRQQQWWHGFISKMLVK